jgi:glycosyltransferase involved in cell wall biosynthesis
MNIKKIRNQIQLIIGFFKKKISNYTSTLVILKPEGRSQGTVLLSYIVAPFVINCPERFPSHHSNHWECYQIAKSWLEYGYTVHVINWDDEKFIPTIAYNFFVDIHSNLQRLHSSLNPECIKILHITGSHWLHQNLIEYQRLEEIKNRKGKILLPRRIVKPCKSIEYADVATILGNQVTINSFPYLNKEFYTLPVTTTVLFPFNREKEYSKVKKNFLWMGSNGLVLKGLDLLLDTFINLPEFHLYICGPIENEEDFVELYFHELYNTANIHLIGWIDPKGKEFTELLAKVIGIIYPSASEGQAGSVITCMHGGLIPIISKYSGVEVNDF